ncbi:MAG TPA: hypothetical protein VFW38_05315 [Solirubrobacteraceae bacterium]|nr:hypothetical protein [Solirubrobacteraceae bacterium]
MTRLARAWGALEREQRLAAGAAVALLVTMFLPWYELQSLDRKTGAINSHSISAFGDVSFVEAAVFLVAAGVLALLFARAERRDFHMPGSDGTVVMVAGGWATLLIFYRVFSRPDGHGYPVGIEWGFFLAFVAAGLLTWAGWRMRALAEPEPPLLRPRGRPRDDRPTARTTSVEPNLDASPSQDLTVVSPGPPRAQRAGGRDPVPARGVGQPRPASAPATAAAASTRKRPRFPPAPQQQLSFEDQHSEPEPD